MYDYHITTLLGISAFTNSISARQRWAQSHFVRTQLISGLYDELGNVYFPDNVSIYVLVIY